MFFAATAAGQEVPTVRLVCDERCVAIDPLPDEGKADLVFLHRTVTPVVRSGAHRQAVVPCADGTTNLCAEAVPVAELLVDDVAVVELVGPEVTTTPVSDDGESADRFDDVVLVGGAKGFRCSGVVLDRRHVLTAAHCAPATVVGVGARDAEARRIAVAATVRHPTADVAVLELAAPVEVKLHPRRGEPSVPAPRGRVRVLGYGVRDPLRMAGFGTRRQVDVLVDGWGCRPDRAAQLGCSPATEMYFRDPRGNDTCFGDSGGPVFEAADHGWRLVAVTSRGTQPRRVLCGEGGIYVRVDLLAPWLRKVLTP